MHVPSDLFPPRVPVAQPASRWSIPAWVKYLFLGCFFTFLLPYAFQEDITAAHTRTDATVQGYTASTTVNGIVYSPSYVFADQQGISHQVQFDSYANTKPFAVGEQVSLYYVSASPTQAFLEHDPYRDFTKSLLRTVGIPFFLLALLFIVLQIRKVSETVMRRTIFAARFFLPWLMGMTLFVAFLLFSSHIPSTMHFSGGTTTYDAGQGHFPSVLAGVLAILIIVVWYLIRWPLLIIDIFRDLKGSYDRHIR